MHDAVLTLGVKAAAFAELEKRLKVPSPVKSSYFPQKRRYVTKAGGVQVLGQVELDTAQLSQLQVSGRSSPYPLSRAARSVEALGFDVGK